ncbi:hypothetical protein [Pasteurella sp. PK-2025]|uniref:hypothetical protein n=1 Tax=unclassified Pasteurella TaxID=2621516 RepID=UPI003C76DC9F
MNKEDAILFLKNHQPLPDDKNLTTEIIEEFDKIREFFILEPDDEVISLFLNSYGNGDGWGVYPLVEDVLLNCTRENVILEIKKILEDKNTSDNIRYWVTQNAEFFVDKRLEKGLKLSLTSENKDISETAKYILDNETIYSTSI